MERCDTPGCEGEEEAVIVIDGEEVRLCARCAHLLTRVAKLAAGEPE